ncbi:MAG: hypothetical protein ACLPT6_07835 [Desulfobaccales bacterium]
MPRHKVVWSKVKNAIVLVVLAGLYYGFSAVYYAISNMFKYHQALAIMSLILFSTSVILVYLHDYAEKMYSWDILGLAYLNNLRTDDHIYKYQLFKRLFRWTLRKGFWTIYVIGPIIIGPYVVAIILRKDKSCKSNLSYIIPGTLLSVLFWVTTMKGIGTLTWHQYIIPAISKLFG